MEPRAAGILCRPWVRGAAVTAAVLALAAALAAAPDVQVAEEVREGGRVWVTASFAVAAPPEAVFRMLLDVASFPEFLPDLDEARLLEEGPGYQIAFLRGGRGLLASEQVLRRTYDAASRRIAWSLVRGRAREVRGAWALDPSPGGGTRASYEAYVDAGSWIPDALTRRVLRSGVPRLAEAVRRRAESGGAWQSPEYRERSR